MLRRGRLLQRVNANELPRAPLVFEFDDAVNQGEERVVFTATDILSRFPFSTALTSKDVATKDLFSAEFLQPQPLRR
jgi:hypothetical protein